MTSGSRFITESKPTKDESLQDNPPSFVENDQDVGSGQFMMEGISTPTPQQIDSKSAGRDNFIDNDDEVTRNTALDLGAEFTKTKPYLPCCGKRCKITRGWKIILIIGTSACLALMATRIWEGIEASNKEPFQDIWKSDISMKWVAAKRGRGLELTVVSSVSSQWNEIFAQSIKDWEAAPALSLNVSSIDDEVMNSSCDHMRGAMRICNGEYGDTGWLGVNELFYYEENGENYIVSSVAKMNDSELKGVSNNEKRYVMCHEIGHGFGLPHRVSSTLFLFVYLHRTSLFSNTYICISCSNGLISVQFHRMKL